MFEELQSLRVFDAITFLHHNHRYLIKGRPAPSLSVTGLLEKYKPKFDKVKWSNIKAQQLGVTPEEILETWRINNLYSTWKGTILHNYIENYYNNKVIPYNRDAVIKEIGEEVHENLNKEVLELVKQFHKFYDDYNYLLPIKNELVVGDINDTGICGMMDLLVYNPKVNGFEIYDYKTNKDIRFTNKFDEIYHDPISDLQVCEFNTYSLQLAAYKNFIEKYSKIEIKNTYVIWFNVINTEYKLIKLNPMQERIENILTHIKSTGVLK
jgi:hypothetical protein